MTIIDDLLRRCGELLLGARSRGRHVHTHVVVSRVVAVARLFMLGDGFNVLPVLW